MEATIAVAIRLQTTMPSVQKSFSSCKKQKTYSGLELRQKIFKSAIAVDVVAVIVVVAVAIVVPANRDIFQCGDWRWHSGLLVSLPNEKGLLRSLIRIPSATLMMQHQVKVKV